MIKTENASEVLEKISPALIQKISNLIMIFKAIGVVFIIYFIYLIVKGILRWKDRRRLKRIEQKVDKINAKLDKIIEKNKKKK